MNRSRHFFHHERRRKLTEPKPQFAEELAPAYVFLASDADSSFITGTVLHVAGGEIAGG